MSEEEIIEIVNEIKNHQIAVFEPKENIQITRNYFTEKQRQALQGLLDLYNKEKEKNKRNKRIALNKLEKLKNGIENDFPIKLGEQQLYRL